MGVNPEGVVRGYLEALPALEPERYGTPDALEEGLRTGAVRAVA